MGKKRLKASMAALVVVALYVGAGASAFADIVKLGVGEGGVAGDHIIGEVIPAVSSSDGPNGLLARDELMIDTLRVMGLGTRTADGISPEYYRSTTAFGTLPDATQTGALYAGSIGDMTLSGLN